MWLKYGHLSISIRLCSKKVANIHLFIFSLLHSMLKFTVKLSVTNEHCVIQVSAVKSQRCSWSFRNIFRNGFWHSKTKRKWLSLSTWESYFTQYYWRSVWNSSLISFEYSNAALWPEGGALLFGNQWTKNKGHRLLHLQYCENIGPWCV